MLKNNKKKPKIFYRPDKIPLDYKRDLGDPGQFPYTRGIHPKMYADRFWTMRQYAGFGTAEESNQRYRYLLSQGSTGLSVAFDLPTQIGLNSDHALSRGEVGKVGVAIDSLEDMDKLFTDIPISDISTSMTINSTAAIILALYFIIARQRNCPLKDLHGTVQNDILKEYLARGTFIFPPKPSLRLATDVMAYCHQHAPKWNTISISGYHIREAGSTAAQEIAFTLANAETYLLSAVHRGMEVDEVAPRFSFFFNSHCDLFEEVAKFRAARRVWSKLVREDFKASDPRSWKMRIHIQTAGSSLTSDQPNNNIVRVAYQALAAVLGGTQSLHTNAYDEALSLPTEEAAGMALKTQQILAHETGVTQVADPLGGSWYVEMLTRRLEEESLEYLRTIREMGGVLACIENGFIKKEIQDAAYAEQQRMETGDKTVVGVNRYRADTNDPIEIHRPDPGVESYQIRRLEHVLNNRDQSKVSQCLDRVRSVAVSSGNLMDPIIEAMESLATVGEVSNALRDVFGEHLDTTPF
jgi:methylmalonyl-CoA mutase N-terminal domain/subunit